jgi:hypothetical protein
MKKTAYATVIVSVAAALSGLKVRADESTAMTTGSTPTVSTTSSAGKLGVGLIVGEPTGFSAKYWLNDTLALDGAVGWSSHDHTDLYLHSDVLWHNFDLIPVSRGSLPVYFGVGGLVRFRDDNRDNDVGVRVPVGVSYLFDNAPIDVFAEIAPAVDVAPSVRGEVTGGVGIRYWF